VSWWSEGCAEICRKWRRINARARRVLAERELARREIELGTLGWGQADFLTPEMREQVRLIMDFEKQAADAFNKAAALGDEIRQLEQDWTTAEVETERESADFASRRGRAVESLGTAETRAEEARAAVARFEQAVRNLEADFSRAEAVSGQLLAVDSREAEEEWRRAIENRKRIERELLDLRAVLARRRMELGGLDEAVRLAREEVSEIDRAAKLAEDAHNARLAELTRNIAALERSRDQTRKVVDLLEKRKASPFRVIGQCLANDEVAPMNQPEALERVRRTRLRIAELEKSLADSLAESSRADRAELRRFYIASGVTVLLLVLCLLLAR
jgi:tetratricopeptide (TPR) repeat protein